MNRSSLARPGLALTIAALAVASWTSSAVAQPPSSARDLAQEGKALVEAGNLDAGCPKLEEAWRLDSELLGAGFTLGDCYERRGRLASARAQFSTVATKAALRGEPRAAEAKSRADALSDKVSTVTLKVSPSVAAAPGLVVRIDREPVAASSFNAPLPKDGGRYEVTVGAAGRATWSRTIDLPEAHGRVEIAIELGKEGESADPPSRPAAPAGGGGPVPGAAGMAPLRIGGAVVTALGGAGIVLGATFGILAMQRRDESNEPGQCDDTTNLCRTAEGVDLRAQSRLFGDVSTAAFVIGGLAGAAGILMLAIPIGGGPVRAALSPSFIGVEGDL